MEQAAGSGFPVDAELRFIEIGGDLILKKPEDFLTVDLKVNPIYDLKQGKAGGKCFGSVLQNRPAQRGQFP